ncbi:uncharacterized mitochondrial protein AtMg00860-like [Musa acuminata AAA Group]|uniref:uncharacterized mitochondrial protein AtMg00860-like n=1 Tax=Musa acuminata AAA Group TaxID=214697 RepID=UPI0031D9BE48
MQWWTWVHVEHLRTIFKVLRENTLFVKREKCYFAQTEILFLGHRIGDSSIRMDKSKVQAVVEWRTPKKVLELRSFLSFINYYRCFIGGYSKHATPLTELLKKEQYWRWSDKCEATFQDLKAIVLKEQVLKLSDYGEPFEVHIDALDFVIGTLAMKATSKHLEVDPSPYRTPPNLDSISYCLMDHDSISIAPPSVTAPAVTAPGVTIRCSIFP